ncbi:hypothetical protein FACS1894184_08530 [Clostridia bacterium]|nr:hypothetical protein FACS1894184_08530 [Clostridia bacterium]
MSTQAPTPTPYEEMRLITEYAQPIATYLREHRNQHCIVVITDSKVRLVADEFGVPLLQGSRTYGQTTGTCPFCDKGFTIRREGSYCPYCGKELASNPYVRSTSDDEGVSQAKDRTSLTAQKSAIDIDQIVKRGTEAVLGSSLEAVESQSTAANDYKAIAQAAFEANCDILKLSPNNASVQTEVTQGNKDTHPSINELETEIVQMLLEFIRRASRPGASDAETTALPAMISQLRRWVYE